MRTPAATGLILFLVSHLSAQTLQSGALSGIVKDSQNLPVANVSVEIPTM